MIEVVVDTNIIISALLTPGKVRRVLLHPKIRPHAPKRVIDETIGHAAKISRYTGISEAALKPLLEKALPLWITTHDERTIPEETKEKARELIGDVDPYDWPFAALAMDLGVPLWTGDRGLLELSARTGFKHFVAVDTSGVEMLLRGEPLEVVEQRMKEKYS